MNETTEPEDLWSHRFSVSRPSSWPDARCFEEGVLPTARIRRRADDGREGAEREEEEYTRGIPNDFRELWDGASGRGPVEVLKVASRRGATRSTGKGVESGGESEERDRGRVPSHARHFLRLTSSRLAFYLGQTGIRLNALIKLLTSFERPGGRRVSPRGTGRPVFCRPFRPRFLPFIFVPPHFRPRVVIVLHVSTTCPSRTTAVRVVG